MVFQSPPPPPPPRTARQFDDVPLNVVFGERIWRNGGPRLESSRRLFLPAEVLCCLLRKTLRHTVFGVFPLLTPLKKTLCFPISLTIGTYFPPISPNFPQCFPANCALLSHQFPPTFLSISIRLPPNFPPPVSPKCPGKFPNPSFLPSVAPNVLRVGYLGHAKPRFSQARMPYKGQPQHPSEISFSAHPAKMTRSGHDIPPSTKVP